MTAEAGIAGQVSSRPSSRELLVLAALGVVFGDIGTSPLYAFDLALKAAAGLPLQAAVLGVLSLILWTLLVTVTLKYVVFVLEADNQGEGGILALVTRMRLHRAEGRGDKLLFAAGLCGAALIFGDGMLTPAISVLSAVEGLEVVAPSLQGVVVPICVTVLLALFLSQRFGTERIGGLFGPVMLLWFLVIGVLGLVAIVQQPSVLLALSPVPAARMFVEYPGVSVTIAGAAFLAVTGAEALYADLGHFGKSAIRRAWLIVAMPALLLNYLGQGAHALAIGQIPKNPFYELAPTWFGLPLLLLATAATIIASQAILTGAFSLTKQAMEIGLLPHLRVNFTSEDNERHIYVPAVNTMLMIGTILITVAFGSSATLGSAYGIAVAGAMATTTVLLVADQRRKPTWPVGLFAGFALLFLVVDVFFLVTNMIKVLDGGWLPLAVAAGVILIMASWRYGHARVVASQISAAETLGTALGHLCDADGPRGEKTIVFLTRVPIAAPIAMSRLAQVLGLKRQPIIIAHVRIVSRPRTDAAERLVMTEVDQGIWRAEVRFGYLEDSNVPAVLVGAFAIAPDLPRHIVYVVGSERIVPPELGLDPRAFLYGIFSFLARNATRSVDRFGLPSERTLEIGHTIRL